MQQTTNYNLNKIELTDSPPDITVLNPNWDTIDTKLKQLENIGVSSKTYQDAEFPIGKGYVIQIGEILVQAVNQDSLSSGTFQLPKSFADTNYAVVICAYGNWGVNIGAYVKSKTRSM